MNLQERGSMPIDYKNIEKGETEFQKAMREMSIPVPKLIFNIDRIKTFSQRGIYNKEQWEIICNAEPRSLP